MNMTPAEIIAKRVEIARALCARNIHIEKNFPHCKTIVITQDDLDNVPASMLAKMVRDITP